MRLEIFLNGESVPVFRIYNVPLIEEIRYEDAELRGFLWFSQDTLGGDVLNFLAEYGCDSTACKQDFCGLEILSCSNIDDRGSIVSGTLRTTGSHSNIGFRLYR
jgi:hypothetical protein